MESAIIFRQVRSSIELELSVHPAVILSVAKNLIQYSSAPAIASIALCFRADPAVRRVVASLRCAFVGVTLMREHG
jgi:hypothetical protein